jgi:hypothetical protein
VRGWTEAVESEQGGLAGPRKRRCDHKIGSRPHATLGMRLLTNAFSQRLALCHTLLSQLGVPVREASVLLQKHVVALSIGAVPTRLFLGLVVRALRVAQERQANGTTRHRGAERCPEDETSGSTCHRMTVTTRVVGVLPRCRKECSKRCTCKNNKSYNKRDGCNK